ncbi:MAG TPA: PSD1 and planctomycete cytochrome C domain-containing protein [Pirellulales bacterium]|nr:PSD1 and planctomycete cytochrome C domain-containing protein [Pirellulales bacterium]
MRSTCASSDVFRQAGFTGALAALLLAASLARSAAADSPPAAPRYATDVRPILQAKCFRCHGADVKKGELDLSRLPLVLQGGESGTVVVAGKPDESPLLELVLEGAMPSDKQNPLSPAEIEIVRRWIAEGLPLDVTDAGEAGAGEVTEAEIVPLMLLRCAACHGARKQEAGLDLRSKSAMLKGGESGAAIVPGNADESLLLRRIHAGEMPPRTRLVEVSVKPMEPGEVEKLARWIAAGAPEAKADSPESLAEADKAVSDEDRQFWSFRPPRPVAVPSVRDSARVYNPIDAFILQRLESRGLAPAPEAPREVLLRRASFDLTGMPPTPEEVEAFLSDSDPRAYETLIDRLLASPRYGERWGRHWLDLAGYADSEGKREQDLVRKAAYRYRDYVIRALNADKPYDRFLLEQLAGDELADYEHALEITAEIYDNLVATGFLRMAPDATWANITGFVPDRLEVIGDELDVLASSVMGLTLKCARCHSHKFDPIPQRDYYRLAAIFKGAFDEHDWLKPEIDFLSYGDQGKRQLPHVTTAERRAWEQDDAAIRQAIDALRAALDAKAAPVRRRLLDERLARLPEVLRDDLRKMLATPPGERNEVQCYLAGKFEAHLQVDLAALKQADVAFKQAADETERQIAALEGRRQPEPTIRALWDRGEPSPSYVYRRGNYLDPGARVEPGVPAVLANAGTALAIEPPWPGAKQTGRRLAFARWLTRPEHPLTARVMVNRVWKHHFGAGIVRSLGNFGKTGTGPSHPELLDWLAIEFARQGWSLKAMHRLMTTSNTYRQSSAVTEVHERLDPDNRLWSRMPLARLEAEPLRDALLLVSGALVDRPFGPPDPVQAHPDGLVTVGKQATGGWRRSTYVAQYRKQIPTLLEAFDLPLMNPNCIERPASIVAPQALHLLNDGTVSELAGLFAARVRAEAGNDRGRQVERVYLIALGRRPNEDELRLGVETLQRLAAQWRKQETESEAEKRALANYCHAIVNSAEFVYID